MNKLYRVLVFLVFFGLGVPCASAANTTSFIPQTVQMDMGSSQEVQIVMDEVPAGLAGFNVTISVSDPDIAEITAVSFPSWNSIPENSTVPSSSVLIKGVDLGEKVNPNDVNVSLGNITVTGKQAGTAGLNIQPELITADGGSTINSVINPGEINVLDTESPVINSVDLNDSKPKTGDSILVTVDTTDNVGVSSVKANDVSLVHQGGNIWNGSIVALEGTNYVNVSSADAAGNVAWNNSTSYKATGQDKVSPVINSISLNKSTPYTGDFILVTVDTTDNVEVNEVKANDVSLVHQSGNIWNGSITASEGTHFVNVSSADAAGNVAWKNDTSYTATTPELPDTEFPVINSVSLNNNTPNTGGSILVTVDTTDNVGVSSVKANDVSLVHQSGNIWNGSITASEGAHSVNVSSEDAAGHVTWDNDTSYTATAPDPTNSEGELQLWAFDASKVSELPDNIYTANPINSTSNVSLAYNSTLGSIDSSCWYDDGGETYITGAYPAVNENLTFTMGVDSSSQWSYGYIHTSVAYVGVRHASDDSYKIVSYWTSDDGSLLNSSFTIPASSVVDNRVTVSIHSYDSNRTNIVAAGPGLYVITPYTTEKTRKLPYANVIQPLIYLNCYASGADGWVNVHLYNITQSIPRETITPYARNDIMAFGLDYPNVTNNRDGIDFLISRDQTASIYVSENNMETPADAEYDKSLFASGFEGCIHFYPGLKSLPFEEATGIIDSQIEIMNDTFSLTPASWSSSENYDNITHAIYAYNKYGSLYRNGPMGMAFIPNVNTLSNQTWAWWSESSAHGAISPCFTHETDNSPADEYSISPDLFEIFVANLNSKNINLVDFSKWYYSSMAQTATTNVLQSDEDNLKFQLNTSGGYPVNINVQTTISPSSLVCDGVSVPFNQTSDGIQFMSIGNGTYTLKSPVPPVLPIANFTASLTVQFTDTSTNDPTQWNWDFGDGTNSTEQNPVHVYNSEGTYTVKMVATNGAGSSYVKSMVITVTRLIPVANFTSNVTEGYAPLTVQFNDTSINSPAQWNWDFGDGTNSTEQNPVHVFSGEGTYRVTLIVTNGDGSSNPKSMDIKVNRVLVSPVAGFTANSTEGSAPLTVQFTDTSTKDPDEWNWNFGDGSTSTEQNPVHVFNGEGTYGVTLVATNDDGSSDPKSMNIKVNRVPTPPVVNFTAKQTGPLTIQFNDASSNSPNEWNWDFGDGSTSTDANPVHVYAAAGAYTVNLSVSNADGPDTISKAITVTGTSASPTASFTLTPQVGRAPLTVRFTDRSVNAASIKWDFGDGTTSTESNPSHTYTTGFYIVKLTATNGDKSSTAANIIIVGR